MIQNKSNIYGIGTDMIEVSRVKKQIDKDNGFTEKIFTSSEIIYCRTKKNYAQSFAARFAAKESFFKAIGTGWRDGMQFNEIEIINDDLGKPEVKLYGKVLKFSKENNFGEIHVSLSHLKEIASSIIVIEISNNN